MDNKEIEILLKKYREQQASEAEKALLESWYLSWESDAIKDINEQKFTADLLKIAEGLPLDMAVRRINWWPKVASIAAVFALFSIGYLLWPLFKTPSHPLALSVLNAPAGKKQHITLADGSEVWLNEGSELRYPKTFNDKNRQVYLSGEGYFDIKHIADKSFIIHTGNVVTTVLGTAFNIKEDKKKHTFEITVTRGKVSVADGAKILGVITPNRQLKFNTVNHQTVQHVVDALQLVAWRKIELRFNDVTFEEAAKQLEQKFKVTIRFGNDRIKNCRFTGASLNGDKLVDVLKTICDFNNATFETQSNGNILINGEGCD
jgi:transmembrane sensor